MLASPAGLQATPASSTTASSFPQATDRLQETSTEAPGLAGSTDDLDEPPISPKHAAERTINALYESGAIRTSPRTHGTPRPTSDTLQSGGKLVLRSPRKWWNIELGRNICPESPTHHD